MENFRNKSTLDALSKFISKFDTAFGDKVLRLNVERRGCEIALIGLRSASGQINIVSGKVFDQAAFLVRDIETIARGEVRHMYMLRNDQSGAVVRIVATISTTKGPRDIGICSYDM